MPGKTEGTEVLRNAGGRGSWMDSCTARRARTETGRLGTQEMCGERTRRGYVLFYSPSLSASEPESPELLLSLSLSLLRLPLSELPLSELSPSELSESSDE